MARPKRDGKGRWLKGESGNKAGRTSEEMQARIQAMRALAGLVEPSIKRLTQLIHSDDDRVSLGAVKVVLEHVIGKDKGGDAQAEFPTTLVIDGYEIRPREKPGQEAQPAA